jgi:hypothetical protein
MTTATTAARVTGKPETGYDGVTVFSVPSRTSNDVYQVTESNGETRCCCKGFTYRGRCAHLSAVAEYKHQLAKLAKSPAYETAILYRSNAGFSLFKAS